MKLSKAFIEDIRELIRSARATVARGVDVVQVHTNFEIGRRIVQQEQKGKGRAAYGEEVIKALPCWSGSNRNTIRRSELPERS